MNIFCSIFLKKLDLAQLHKDNITKLAEIVSPYYDKKGSLEIFDNSKYTAF